MPRSLRSFARVLFFVVAFLLLAPLVRVQDASTGAICGTVLDPDARPVPSATIALANLATGANYSAVSDADAHFAVDLLPPGDYSLAPKIKGMSPEITPQIHVDVGGIAEIRPVDARDPNQDGNDSNDRIPGYGRNAFAPDYATTDLRLTRRLYVRPRYKLKLVGEACNALNRDNRRVVITDDGFTSTAADFVPLTKTVGIKYFPAYYQRPAHLVSANSAYAPRQVQFALEADLLRSSEWRTSNLRMTIVEFLRANFDILT